MQDKQNKNKHTRVLSLKRLTQYCSLFSIKTAAIILSLFMIIKSPVAVAKDLTRPVSELLQWNAKSIQEVIRLTGAESLSSKGKALIQALRPFQQIFKAQTNHVQLIAGSVKSLIEHPAQPFYQFIQSQSWEQPSDTHPLNRQIALNRSVDVWDHEHLATTKTPEGPAKSTQTNNPTTGKHLSPRPNPHPTKADHSDSKDPQIIVRVQQDKQTKESVKPLIRVEHPESSSEQNLVEASSPRPLEDHQFLDYIEKAEGDLKPGSGLDGKSAKTLSIVREEHKISIQPETLVLKSDEQISLNFKNFKAGNLPNIFIRNDSLVRMVKKSNDHQLIAAKTRQGGSTEIFLLFNNKMAILPVEVLSSTSAQGKELASRTAPAPLISENQLSGLTILKSSAPRAQADAIATTASTPKDILPFTPLTQDGQYLTDQVLDHFNAYKMTNHPVKYEKITFLTVDDRHGLETPYPLPRVKVSVPGTPFEAQTNGQGKTLHIYVPKGSRFLVRTEDSNGLYQDGVHQISLSTIDLQDHQSGAKLVTLPLARKERLKYQQYLSKPLFDGDSSDPEHYFYSSDPASLCGVVTDQDGQPMKEISVKTTASGTRLTYLNAAGNIPGRQPFTGPSGQFCLFNSEPGPMGIKFYDAEGVAIDTFPANMYPGHHIFMNFQLFNRKHIQTNIASTAMAEVHFSRDPLWQKYTLVDMANIIPLGGDLPQFKQDRNGVLSSTNPLPSHEGRYCFVTEPSDFEMTYQCMNEKDAQMNGHVTPLVPGGFMEVLSSRTLLDQDSELQYPDLGSVIIEHGDLVGQDQNGNVQIELVNFQGQRLKAGFEKYDSPRSKAIFFNVSSGTYTVLVKNDQGVLIASDTATVFDGGAITYLKTGNQITVLSSELSQTEHPTELPDKKG